MRFYPIVWRKDGFGTKRIDLPNNVMEGRRGLGQQSNPSIRCAHYQIWYRDLAGTRVVDRASTAAIARRRIRLMKANGFPLFTGAS